MDMKRSMIIMNMTMNINAQDNEKKISPDIEIIYKRLIEMIYEYRKRGGKAKHIWVM